MEANWVGLLLVSLGACLAFKLLGAAPRLLLWLVVLVGAYWFLAPMLGWPTVSDLVYVFGPDLGGRRIEEVADPSRLAGQAADRVVDGVVDELAGRGGFERSEVDLPLPEADTQAAPEPEPEPRAPDTPRDSPL